MTWQDVETRFFGVSSVQGEPDLKSKVGFDWASLLITFFMMMAENCGKDPEELQRKARQKGLFAGFQNGVMKMMLKASCQQCDCNLGDEERTAFVRRVREVGRTADASFVKGVIELVEAS